MQFHGLILYFSSTGKSTIGAIFESRLISNLVKFVATCENYAVVSNCYQSIFGNSLKTLSFITTGTT